MQDIDLTAQKIVEQIGAGNTEEAADTLDKAYRTMGPDEFRKVVEAMERKTRGGSGEGDRESASREIKPTIQVKDWIVYTPWQGQLFDSRGKQA